MKKTKNYTNTAEDITVHDVPPAKGMLYGFDTEGRFKMEYRGKRWIGEGDLYKVTPPRKKDEKIARKLGGLHEPFRRTANMEQKSGIKHMFSCIGAKTGRRYFFVGYLKADIKEPPTTVKTAGTVIYGNEEETSSPPYARRSTRSSADIDKLQEELAAIRAARDAGFDPDLKMRHVSILVLEAFSTIYRKIKQGLFPPPQKRGSGSFWKLSDTEAYQAGTWAQTAK